MMIKAKHFMRQNSLGTRQIKEDHECNWIGTKHLQKKTHFIFMKILVHFNISLSSALLRRNI